MEHIPLNLLLDYVVSSNNYLSNYDNYWALIFKKLETTDLSNIREYKCRENLKSFLNNAVCLFSHH